MDFMRQLLILILTSVIMAGCEKMPEFNYDTSYEEDDVCYIYYHFINKSGRSLYCKLYEKGDTGFASGTIEHNHDFVYDESRVKYNPETILTDVEMIEVFYDYETGDHLRDEYGDYSEDATLVKYEREATDANRSPFYAELWEERQIDKNSWVRTFVFTKEDYNYANSINR